MIYRFSSLALLLLLLVARPASAENSLKKYMSGDYPRPTSEYVCLMDASTGKVLYYKNMLTHRPPASLTKMAAAIVLIEQGKLTDTVTAPDAVKGTPESSLHLSPGETISLHDLLYAMLLRSANDTPVAGAYYLCGGIPPFVTLMNAKVDSIGCENTNFVTPNGLYADGHYSCAYDLALIARYGLTHLPTFRQIVATKEYRVTRSIHKRDSLVTNTAMTYLNYFPGADGVKTGYISQAGHCFVGSATRKDWQLIAVSLDSPQCRSDVVQMLSYGFAHFKQRLIFKHGTPAGTVVIGGRPVPVSLGSDLDDIVPVSQLTTQNTGYRMVALADKPPTGRAISAGESVGTVVLCRGDKKVMSTDAIASLTIAASEPLGPVGVGRSVSVLGIVGRIVALIVLVPALFVSIRILDLALHARKIAKDSRRRRSGLAEDVGTMDP